MPRPRFATTLAARAGTFGVPDELVGDVLEEVERGRSRLWLWQQLLGLYWFALIAGQRRLWRPTPERIALAMSAMLFLAASIAPSVVAAWLVFYYVMGAVSLFTQMTTYTGSADSLRMGVDVEAPRSHEAEQRDVGAVREINREARWR